MITSDIDQLRQLLVSLAETYDRRAPTETAIKNWFVTLHQYSWQKVEHALQTWMPTKPRMPAPSDIRALLEEQAVAAREAAWQAAKEQERKQIANLGATDTGLRTLQTLKGMLGRQAKAPLVTKEMENMITCVGKHYRCSDSELNDMRRCAAADPQDAATCYAALMREIEAAQREEEGARCLST